MTSQTGKQTITLHILSNISRNKGNQTMKFGKLLENNVKNHAVNVAGRLAPNLFLFSKKALYEVKISSLDLGLSFNILIGS